MRQQLSAYSITTGEFVKEIPGATDINAGTDGSLTFTIPKVDSDASYFTGDVALGVEIPALGDVDGSGLKGFGPLVYTARGEVDSRYIFSALDDGSLTETDGVLTVTAKSIAAAAFPWMVILKGEGDPLEYSTLDNPATVIADRVARAKARGLDYGITVVDVGGWDADNPAAGIEFDNLVDLYSFYTALDPASHAELQWVGTTLYAMPPGTMAQNRAAIVEFVADDFSASPVKYDRTRMADTVVALGDNGNFGQHPYPAVGKIARVQVGGVTDGDILNTVAQRDLTGRQTPDRQITADLVMGADPKWVPYIDFHKWTTVRVPKRGGGTEDLPIASMSITPGDGTDMGASIVLDTKIKSAEVRRAEAFKLGVGGISDVAGNGSLIQSGSVAYSKSVVVTLPGTSGSVTVNLGRTFVKGMNFVVMNGEVGAQAARVIGTGGTGHDNMSGTFAVHFDSGVAGLCRLNVVGVQAS